MSPLIGDFVQTPWRVRNVIDEDVMIFVVMIFLPAAGMRQVARVPLRGEH